MHGRCRRTACATSSTAAALAGRRQPCVQGPRQQRQHVKAAGSPPFGSAWSASCRPQNTAARTGARLHMAATNKNRYLAKADAPAIHAAADRKHSSTQPSALSKERQKGKTTSSQANMTRRHPRPPRKMRPPQAKPANNSMQVQGTGVQKQRQHAPAPPRKMRPSAVEATDTMVTLSAGTLRGGVAGWCAGEHDRM